MKRPTPPAGEPAAQPTANEVPSKRPRSQFLSPEHYKLIRRYIVNVGNAISEREKKALDLDSSNSAVDTIINVISTAIGNLWEVSVRLSKMRIDTTMHNLVGEVLLMDESVPDSLLRFREIDRQQRATGGTGSTVPASEEATVNVALPDPAAASLFDEDATDEEMFHRRQREAAIVKLKQAELTREVNVVYINTALELYNNFGIPLAPIPERSRRMFTSACALYYESFVDRVLVNYIQQRQRRL